MIVDGHNHIGRNNGVQQLVEELIERMNRAKVDMAVAFPFVQVIENDYIAVAMKKYPGRIIGFASINPRQKNSTVELNRCIRDRGLKGLKLHPVLHGYPLSDHFLVDPLFEICTKYKVPVIVHGGDDLFSTPLHFREIAETFSEIPIIMVHSGFMFATNEALTVAKKCDNIYLDTTAVAATLEISRFVKELGAERVVMGTDTPFLEFEISIKTIEMALPKEHERELVLGGNYTRLLKLKK